jgi:spoIIIJ-associated protein
MERPTLEMIAPTVDEAIERGLEQLGATRDMIDVEILDEGSKGLFGLGSRQVRVRLTLKGGDPSAPAASAATEKDSLLTFARKTTEDLLLRMKVEGFVTTAFGEKDEHDEIPLLVDVHGDDLSVLIGRRAETLNALQYIIGLIVSKQADRWVQVLVDVEGYRARREKQLRQMARRTAEQVVKTGKRQVLEPMPASDRRFIHLELRNHPDVETRSIGEEPVRKVTVEPKR